MSRKTDAPNLGLPLFADPCRDLAGKPDVFTDSWYVLCNFRAGERDIGFEWHQANFVGEDGVKVATTEFLLMAVDSTGGTWLDHAANEAVAGNVGADFDRCRVTSSFGTLAGDHKAFTLNLAAPDGAVDVVMRPKEQTIYNGTVGLLPLLGAQSFQFAFPNMEVEGTVRLRDEIIPVTGTTAWLDRQWTYPLPSGASKDFLGNLPSWLWLGITLTPDTKAAISLWDVCYSNGDRHAFATILDVNGVQTNHIAHLTYRGIWQSDRTGNSYPAGLDISIPTADLKLTLDALLDRPEFSHGDANGKLNISGCQSPCSVRGHYGSVAIDRMAIVEMIGDVCGQR